MRELLSTNTKIDFMGKRGICVVLSLIAVALSLYVFVE